MKKLFLASLLFLSTFANPWDTYHTNAELRAIVSDSATRLGCEKISLGFSSLREEITGISCHTHPSLPTLALMGPVHGDETAGREGLLHFLQNVSDNSTIFEHVNLIILPSLNPDGFRLRKRTTATGAHLNRDFPESRQNFQNTVISHDVQMIQDFLDTTDAHAFIWYHGGAEVVSWGADSTHTLEKESTFQFSYAEVYAQNVPYISESRQFSHGLIRGCDWYSIDGSASDYAMEKSRNAVVSFTVEISHNKHPDLSQILDMWEPHEHAISEVARILNAAYVYGKTLPNTKIFVTDAGKLPASTDRAIFSDSEGNFLRPVFFGNSSITFMKENYHTRNVVVDIQGPTDIGEIALRGM